MKPILKISKIFALQHFNLIYIFMTLLNINCYIIIIINNNNRILLMKIINS